MSSDEVVIRKEGDRLVLEPVRKGSLLALPRFLLDTNIVSHAIHEPAGAVRRRIAAVGEANTCTSIIVACELRFGVLKRNAVVLSGKVEQFLARIDVRSLEKGVDLRYAELRTALERAGTPISANDMLIAAHALALDCVLVTANVREFRRVPGLVVENWLD
jgi:tRNA(fMet)-specific endonuclease VapC